MQHSTSDATTLYTLGQKAQRNGDYAVALADLTPAANAGIADAQLILGQMYQEGQGVTPDNNAARTWYEKAAQGGSAGALLNLGLLYRQGIGVPQDAQRALEYFMAAKVAGHLKAPRYIGLYYQETGNSALAFSYYQLGAAQGDITSQYYLGRAYELGQGTAQDYAQAFKWYTTSAQRGDLIAVDGMVGLAGLYERGLGVAQDMNKALALYRQAAGLGNRAAKAALARLEGNG